MIKKCLTMQVQFSNPNDDRWLSMPRSARSDHLGGPPIPRVRLGPCFSPGGAARSDGGTSGILAPGSGSSLGPQPTKNMDSNKKEHDKIVVHFVFALFFIIEQFWTG